MTSVQLKQSISQLQGSRMNSGRTLLIITGIIVAIVLIGFAVYKLVQPGGALSPYWAYLQGDRFGGDVEVPCGTDKTQKDLQERCKNNPTCVGYTMNVKIDEDGNPKFKPWCMKTESSEKLAPLDNHRFFYKPKI